MYKVDKEKAAQRLKEILERLGIKSDRQFALSIGADPSYFGKAMNGKIVLSNKYIKKMYENHSINPDWYLYGKGDIKDPFDINLLNDPSADYGNKNLVQLSNFELHKILGDLTERLIRMEAHAEVFESSIAGLQSTKPSEFMKNVGELRKAVREAVDRRFSELSKKFG